MFRILFLLSIFGLSQANNSSCGPLLCGGGTFGKFAYKSDHIYKYSYEASGNSEIADAPTQGVHLSANISLRFLSPCDALLAIKDVSIVGKALSSSGSSRGKELEQHFLRFSFEDGLIKVLCPSLEESLWALNLKRGILSAFQNTMKRLDLNHRGQEEDVLGDCKVSYKMSSTTSSSLTVEKKKELNSCGKRFQAYSILLLGKPKTSMPLLSSTTSCQHIVDRRLLAGVTCEEYHDLRGTTGRMRIQQILKLIQVYVPPPPPQSSNNDTRNNDFFEEDDEEEEEEEKKKEEIKIEEDTNSPWIISQTMDEFTDLINFSPEEENNLISRRESLLFEHSRKTEEKKILLDVEKGRKALSTFCQSLKNGVSESSSVAFEGLISILRSMSPSDMMTLSNSAPQICQGDRTPFDSLLSSISSPGSVHVMKERILRGECDTLTCSSWINSLHFLPSPSLGLVGEAVSILRARDKHPNILLAFSTLAWSFCQENPNCLQNHPIQLLGKLYEKYFAATACATPRRKELEQMLMYLKGVGNFGQLSSNGTLAAFYVCLQNNEKVEVRVAAIRALRRTPCEDEGTTKMLKSIFEDEQGEDDEVRIEAFISLIMRCPTYTTIKWIKNALAVEKSNQVGSFVSTFLQNLSKARNVSSSKSHLHSLLKDIHLPKNFPTQITRYSRNFQLSTSSKGEGNFGVALDSNVIFSRTSYIPRSISVNLTLDIFGSSINLLEGNLRIESLEHFIESLIHTPGKVKGRERREGRLSKRKMRTLAVEYDAMKRYYDDPIISLSLGTLGAEIYFKRIQEEGGRSPLLSLPSFVDTNWGKSRILLDSSFIIPTGLGTPLNLEAKATSLFKLAQQREPLGEGRRGFKGKFIPSALLSLEGGMWLNIGKEEDTKTGVKLLATIRSSISLEAKVEMDSEGNMFDIQFGIPTPKTDILHLKTSLLFQEEKSLQNPPEFSTKTCTPTNFLKLCVSSSSRRTFPSSSHLLLSLDKTNPSLLRTGFHYLWNNNQTKTHLTLTTTFEEEESSQTIYGLVLDVEKERGSLELVIPTTEINLGGGGGGQLTIFSTSASFTTQTEEGGRRKKILPRLLVKKNNQQDVLVVQGEIEIEEESSGVNSSIVFLGAQGTAHWWGRPLLNITSKANHTSSPSICTEWESSLWEVKGLMRRQHYTKDEEEEGHYTKRIDHKLGIIFLKNPNHNLAADWAYQSSTEDEDEDWVEHKGKICRGSHNNSCLQFEGKSRSDFEKSLSSFALHFVQNSSKIDLILKGEGSFYNSSVELSYSELGGRRIISGFKMRRRQTRAAPLLIQADFHLMALPEMEKPLKVSLLLQEQKSVYQGRFSYERESDKLVLDVLEAGEKRMDARVAVSLGISWIQIDNWKLGLHLLNLDKERKLELSSEYGNEIYAIELGHKKEEGERHKMLGSLTQNSKVFLLLSSLRFEDESMELNVKTELGPKFPELYASLELTRGKRIRLELRGPQEVLFFLEGKIDGDNDIILKIDTLGFINLNLFMNPAQLRLEGNLEPLQNLTCNLTLDLGCLIVSENVCRLRFDSSWGKNGKDSLGIEGEIDREDLSPDDATPQNQIPPVAKFTLHGNINSTIEQIRQVTLKFNHLREDQNYLASKTEAELQLPNEKEISVGLSWSLPSGAAQLQIKTPFEGYTNIDLQTSIGHQDETGDLLASAGIYMDDFQYSLVITGTPRFDQDGALGFLITSSSNPKYEKIFGSFSYAFGGISSGRLAVQLGYPLNHIVGLETGWEFNSWAEFSLYFTSTTPLKMNALLKLDSSRMFVLKVEGPEGEESLNFVSEWNIVSFESFDIRLQASTPFPLQPYSHFGLLLKNSWEDEMSYESQGLAWLKEQQFGFKLLGGEAEVEDEGEEGLLSLVKNLEIEIFPMNLKALLSLSQKESRFKFLSTFNLSQGPIHVEAHLDLLDVFRFNENLTITTPYGGLSRLEVELSPAFILDKGLYNFGLATKWIRHREEYKAGLFFRWGDQEVLAEILTQDAIDSCFLDGQEDVEDEEACGRETQKVDVQISQLFHFYSPLEWAKIVKVEYNWMQLLLAEYSSKEANIRAGVQLLNNEEEEERMSADASINFRNCTPFNFRSILDLSKEDKEFSVGLVGYKLESTWKNDLPSFLTYKIALTTPHMEEQSISLIYTHTNERTSGDLEVNALDKQQANINFLLGPKLLSIFINHPKKHVEFKMENTNDGENETNVNTNIFLKCDEEEVEIEVDSETSNGWPKEIRGTITTTGGQGNVSASLEEKGGIVEGSGKVGWVASSWKAQLHLIQQEEAFKQLVLTVDAPPSKMVIHLSKEEFKLEARNDLNNFPPLVMSIKYHKIPNSLLKLEAPIQIELESEGVLVLGGNLSYNFNSFWKTNFSFDGKYNVLNNSILDDHLPHNFLNEDGLRIRVNNFREGTSFLDSKFLFERTSSPLSRVGISLSLSHLEEDLSIKVSCRRGKEAFSLDLASTFDTNFHKVNGKLDVNSTSGLNSRTLLEIGEKVLEVWSDVEWEGNRFLSTFNSSPEHTRILVGLAPGQPPLVSLSFNKEQRRHSARIHLPKWVGDWELELFLSSVDQFQVKVNVSREQDGLDFYLQRDGSLVNGLIDGHLEEDGLRLGYMWDRVNTPELYKLMFSLDTELPFATESAPSPQSCYFSGSYQWNVLENKSSILTQVGYNSVQLFNSSYSSSLIQGDEIGRKEVHDWQLQNHFYPFALHKEREESGWIYKESLALAPLHGGAGVQGEMEIKRNFSGALITLKGSGGRGNGSITFVTDYDTQNVKHSSTLSWTNYSSLGYTMEKLDSKRISLKISYPLRVITLLAGLLEENGGFLCLSLREGSQGLKGMIGWDLEKSFIKLKHPTLPPSGLLGESHFPFPSKLLLDYTHDLNTTLTLSITLPKLVSCLDESFLWNCSTSASLTHPASQLDSSALFHSIHSPHELSIITLIGKEERRRKMAFELFKELRAFRIMVRDSLEDFLSLGGTFPSYLGVNTSEGLWGEVKLDLERPWVVMKGGGVDAQGGVVDGRNVRFNVWREGEEDLRFYFKLEDSKLLKGLLKWRPQLLQEVQESWHLVGELLVAKGEEVGGRWREEVEEAWGAYWANAGDTIEPFINALWSEFDFTNDTSAFISFFSDLYNSSSQLQDLLGFSQLLLEEILMRGSDLLQGLQPHISKAWVKIKDAYEELATAWSGMDPVIIILPPLPSFLHKIKEEFLLFPYYVVGGTWKVGEWVWHFVAAQGLIVEEYLKMRVEEVMKSGGIYHKLRQPFLYLCQKLGNLQQDFYNPFYKLLDLVEEDYPYLHNLISWGSQYYFLEEDDDSGPKTNFIFEPDKGIMSLEQKLPMPWAAFNETPDLQALPEFRGITAWRDFFFWPQQDLFMLPPFPGHAIFVGPKYFFTFDSLAYSFEGGESCNYLLVGDLVDGNFSVVLQHKNNSEMEIHLTVGHHTWIIDFLGESIRDLRRGPLNLPIQSPNLVAYKEGVNLVLESPPKGVRISCKNLFHPICHLSVSRWYSGKVGGLLGKMDQEPWSDLSLRSGKRSPTLSKMIEAWTIISQNSSFTCLPTNSSIMMGKGVEEGTGFSGECHSLFYTRSSPLFKCFPMVEVSPFYQMCMEQDYYCTSASAYLTLCSSKGISLPPLPCGKCGDEMMDGEERFLNRSATTSSADIVFIVEGKECNRGLRSRRKIDLLGKHLEEELRKNGMVENRYAGVVMGGEGVYSEPRVLIEEGVVWKGASGIGKQVHGIPTGNGSRDIFHGIRYTLQHLHFRPGVSKTFILFLCSHCQPQDMGVEYLELLDSMVERGVTLHLFFDSNFLTPKKPNLAKKIFGIDSKRIYTKTDAEGGKTSLGVELRKEVKVPRHLLGSCAPLVFQTNGTIFTTRKLQNKDENIPNLFATVFGRQVAGGAVPPKCQTCYCKGGVGRVECFRCGYQQRYSKTERQETIVAEEEDLEENELIGQEEEEESGEED